MREAVIVDIDGTLCDVRPVRHLVTEHPKDFDAFHRGSLGCLPNLSALQWCINKHRDGHALLIVTARMYRWESLTRTWLNRHLPMPYEGPFMRGDRDFRPDSEVKRDIYDILIEQGWDVREAIDDNPSIINLWLSLGLTTTIQPGWSE
jgi:hypothetical protein